MTDETSAQPNMLEELFGPDADAFRRHMVKPFVPIASHHAMTDQLLVLQEDVSFRAQYVPGSCVELLWHPHEKRLVGVKINGFSRLAPPEVIAAYRQAFERQMREIREAKD